MWTIPNQYRADRRCGDIFHRDSQAIVKYREISRFFVPIKCNFRLFLQASSQVFATLWRNFNPAYKAMFAWVLNLWFRRVKVAVKSSWIRGWYFNLGLPSLISNDKNRKSRLFITYMRYNYIFSIILTSRRTRLIIFTLFFIIWLVQALE